MYTYIYVCTCTIIWYRLRRQPALASSAAWPSPCDYTIIVVVMCIMFSSSSTTTTSTTTTTTTTTIPSPCIKQTINMPIITWSVRQTITCLTDLDPVPGEDVAEDVYTPGLHNKIPALKIFARGWVAQEHICYTISAKISGIL